MIADGGAESAGAGGEALLLENEFAAARVELDLTALGPRLKVVDLRSGREAFFDPLEVATLAWLTRKDVAELLDPSRARWRSDDPGESDEVES